jgi:CDP-L-myo-inositol myo-inositolphosphotransferase
MTPDIAGPAPLVLAIFEGLDPSACVAGLSIAARIAAAAKSAGLGEIWIVAPNPLSAEVIADLERVGPKTVRVIAQVGDLAGRAVVAWNGRYLPSQPQLVTFLAGDAQVLTVGGIPAVAKGPALDRAGPTLAADDAIDLADTKSARWRIIRATAKRADGVVSRWLNRPVSQAITRWIIGIPGVRPSHMTLVCALVSVVMFAVMLLDRAHGLLIGGLLFHAASVLDGVDGELARATFRSSRRGAMLDTRVDLATNLGFFVGLTVGLTRLYGIQHAMFCIAFVLVAASGMLLLGWLLARSGQRESFNGLKTFYRRRYPTGFPNAVTETIIAITSRDFIAFASAVFIVVGWTYALSWLPLVVSILWFTAILCAAPQIFRDGRAVHG